MPFINRDYDWRANMPGIVKKAAVRTLILSMLALVFMVGVAWAATGSPVGDPTGAATGGIADVVAATPGAPTLT